MDGVGYGLFTAEDIAQDDFVIEYVGELITHDEGVRREARRGDVFDEESNISYVFYATRKRRHLGRRSHIRQPEPLY